MTKQKQSRLDLVENQLKALVQVVKRLIEESNYLKDISVGTLQLVKKMPDYDKALEDLTAELKDEEAKKEGPQEANQGNEKKLEL